MAGCHPRTRSCPGTRRRRRATARSGRRQGRRAHRQHPRRSPGPPPMSPRHALIEPTSRRAASRRSRSSPPVRIAGADDHADGDQQGDQRDHDQQHELGFERRGGRFGGDAEALTRATPGRRPRDRPRPRRSRDPSGRPTRRRRSWPTISPGMQSASARGPAGVASKVRGARARRTPRPVAGAAGRPVGTSASAPSGCSSRPTIVSPSKSVCKRTDEERVRLRLAGGQPTTGG